MPVFLLLLAMTLAALSGVPGLWMQDRGQRLATLFLRLASLLGLLAVALEFLHLPLPELAFDPEPHLRLDPPALWFLLPVLVIPPLASQYGHAYWPHAEHRRDSRKLRLFFGLMTAAMLVLCLAQSSIVFLLAWEVMALSAWFLVTAQDDQPESQRAGWHYLAATHVGALCLFGLFAGLAQANGDFALTAVQPGRLSQNATLALWLLGFLGFGLKAGLVPLHIWLPGAHATAPSHVSALLSGVMLNMGILGLFRLSTWLPDAPTWTAWLLVMLGLLSALYAVALALAQQDLKRALAYSSVENLGLVAVGLGLALVARQSRETLAHWELVATLGLGAALLHMWVHSTVKTLLFLGAGAVVHATGTRDTTRLGGLAKQMPQAATLFGLGALALTGLPPLGAFVSEAMLLLGWLRLGDQPHAPGNDTTWVLATLVLATLTLIAALAVALFVQLFGLVWLGEPRTSQATHLHEPPLSMLLPMRICAFLALILGVAPLLVAPLLDPVLQTWAGSNQLLLAMTPVVWLGALSLAVWLLLALVTWLTWRRIRRNMAVMQPTWDCGYAQPTPRMQYTTLSFSQWPVTLLRFLILPRLVTPSLHTHADRPFARPGPFTRVAADPLLDRLLLPVFSRIAQFSLRLRVLQSGRTQAYFLYMIVTLIALLLWR